MLRKIEIKTDAYDKPYVTDAMFADNDGIMKLKWTQKHEGDKLASIYEVLLDRDTGVVTVNRKGEAASELVFDTGKMTEGVFNTQFGVMNIDIETQRIVMPSDTYQGFEISYRLSQTGGVIGENVFAVRFL